MFEVDPRKYRQILDLRCYISNIYLGFFKITKKKEHLVDRNLLL